MSQQRADHLAGALRGAAALEDEATRLVRSLWHSHAALPLREVLGRLLDGVLRTLDATIGSVLLLDPDSRMRVAASRGLSDDVVRSTCVEPGAGISGHVAQRGEPLLVRNVETDERFRRTHRERYLTLSCVCAPVVCDEAVRGVLCASSKHGGRAFDRRDLALVAAVGRRGSALLAGAQLAAWTADRAVRLGTPARD